MSTRNVLRLVGPEVNPPIRINDGVFGSIGRRLFGCRHYTLSRPFTGAGQTYVVCLYCGMRRRFSLTRWRAEGGFYAQT